MPSFVLASTDMTCSCSFLGNHLVRKRNDRVAYTNGVDRPAQMIRPGSCLRRCSQEGQTRAAQ
jgi:hypothetical protein